MPGWLYQVGAACHAEGRDPATLARYAAVSLELPGAPPGDDPNAIKGSPEELAVALQQYADAGISHVQIWLQPFSPAGIEAFARTLEILDLTGSQSSG